MNLTLKNTTISIAEHLHSTPQENPKCVCDKCEFPLQPFAQTPNSHLTMN